VAGGRRVSADLQQICALQSLLSLQVLGQAVLQMPPQHSSPAMVLQSTDWVQAFGQGACVGFRHSPAARRVGSTRAAVVQQISLLLVLQAEESAHAFGHLLGGKQIGS